MTIAELIERLKMKDQAAEVEFIVAEKNGKLVTVDVSTQAGPMIRFLKPFTK